MPGDEAHTLYARFEPRRPEWPTREPDLVPAQLENGTVRLLAGPAPEGTARSRKPSRASSRASP
jgi:hypothetical protein